MLLIGIETPILKKGFDLIKALSSALKKETVKFMEGDIVVISSKVLALSHGRIMTIKTQREIKKLIAEEADIVFSGALPLTLKDGILIPRAGIDFSNAEKGKAILWPKKPWQTTRTLWEKLREIFRMKKIGVIISDSHCQPLRLGVTGIAIAWAGFYGIEDVRGQKDIYGKPLRVTRKAVADNLASAALVLMGEADEKIPFVLIRNAPVKFTDRMQSKKEIFIKPKDCLFNGIYSEKFKKLLE